MMSFSCSFMPATRLSLWLVPAVLLSGCADMGNPPTSSPAPNGGGATVSFASDIQPLFNTYCASAGCHGDVSPQNSFRLTSYANTIATGVHAPNVIPGDAANSTLYRIVTPASSPGLSRMPFGGPYLTTSQQQLIRDWINEGALNN